MVARFVFLCPFWYSGFVVLCASQSSHITLLHESCILKWLFLVVALSLALGQGHYRKRRRTTTSTTCWYCRVPHFKANGTTPSAVCSVLYPNYMHYVIDGDC